MKQLSDFQPEFRLILALYRNSKIFIKYKSDGENSKKYPFTTKQQSQLSKGAKMSSGNTPKINVRNSVSECAQSLKKENAGKFQNYGIKDCIASIAATKVK